MRKTTTGPALILALAAVLLTGCSGGGEDEGAKGKASPSASPSGKPGEGGTGGDEVAREVVLEVQGEGKTQVAYVAGTNAVEQVTLPWTKTVRVPLKGAELKVGVPVTIVPGSVQDENGQFKPAVCVIKVDGRKVDDNDGGRDVTGCKHMLK